MGIRQIRFLKRLKENLLIDTRNITIDFNPWIFNKSNAISEEFFKALSSALAPYNRSLINEINDYSNRVLRPARETYFKFLDALIGNLFRTDDIKNKIDSINSSISLSSKKIIVFIDDMDRLNGMEIIETLKLIRNTANFNNLFFIVAIDYNYIVNILKKSNQIDNETDYLKKIFQLNIALPAFRKDILKTEFKKMLLANKIDEKQCEKIISAFPGGEAILNEGEEDGSFISVFPYLFEELIENIRDLKRFYNSLIISFDILNEEVEVSDLVVLELIRNKNPEIYNSILNQIIISGNLDSWKINEDILKSFTSALKPKDIINIQSALNFIISNSKNKNSRRFSLPHNFYLYFSYQLFNLISFSEFNNAFNAEEDVLVEKFEMWIKDGKQRELILIISNIGQFENSTFFEKMISALLRASNTQDELTRLWNKLILHDWHKNKNLYFNNDDKHVDDFIIRILEKGSISELNRTFIAYELLYDLLRDRHEFDVTIRPKELIRIMYKIFDEYLRKEVKNNHDLYNMFYMQIYKFVNNNRILFPPACRRYKNFLLHDDMAFTYYIKSLVRSLYNPLRKENDDFVFDPWLIDIFPNKDLFLNRLTNIEFNDDSMTQLQGILIPHINQYYLNSIKSFKLGDNAFLIYKIMKELDPTLVIY
ncbi:MAG: hypothetical protein IPJ09_19200 [Saprospiraceae bacterium]|nr:hypothetical protein [Saprospiraceae bacterium]